MGNMLWLFSESSGLDPRIDALAMGLDLAFVLLLLTKLLDVASTLKRIRSLDDETNPFAHGLMRRFGVYGGVAVISGIYLAICGLYYALLFVPFGNWRALAESGESSGFWFFTYHLTTGLGLLFVSLVQASVAHHNGTGRSNCITRVVAQLHAQATKRFHRSR